MQKINRQKLNNTKADRTDETKYTFDDLNLLVEEFIRIKKWLQVINIKYKHKVFEHKVFEYKQQLLRIRYVSYIHINVLVAAFQFSANIF